MKNRPVEQSPDSPLFFALCVVGIAFGPFAAAGFCGWFTDNYKQAFQVLGVLLLFLWPAGVTLAAIFSSASMKFERARAASYVAMARAKYDIKESA